MNAEFTLHRNRINGKDQNYSIAADQVVEKDRTTRWVYIANTAGRVVLFFGSTEQIREIANKLTAEADRLDEAEILNRTEVTV